MYAIHLNTIQALIMNTLVSASDGEVFSHGLDLPEVLLRCSQLMRSRSARDGDLRSILVAEVPSRRLVFQAHRQLDGSWRALGAP